MLKENIFLDIGGQQVHQEEISTFLGATLDSRLKWKPHTDIVMRRTYRKLSVMKTVGGNQLGNKWKYHALGLYRSHNANCRVSHNLMDQDLKD